MFQCIACSKQAVEEGEEQVRQTETVTGTEGGTPATDQAVKSLTSQLKDMALKFTRTKQPTRSSGARPSTYRRGSRSYDYHNNSTGVQGIGSDQPQRRNEPVAAHAPEVHDEDENIMWIAQVEPGIHISFVPLSTGGNDLRRIQFNRDMFDKWQAQHWWGQNCGRIMELYNVQRFDRQALNTPPNSEDERDTPPISRQPSRRDGRNSPVAAWLNNDSTLRNDQYYQPSGITMDQGNSSQNMNVAGSSIPSRTSSRDELSFVNSSEIEGEWIEQDVPGVFLTIRQLPDGSKDLLRVRFSRQRFGEDDAKKWWEENRERIQVQYL